MTDMNHLDDEGNVHMVDVGAKPESDRVATAMAVVTMKPETKERLFAGNLPKGDALATVRIAAIQATKRTPDLIPLCHPISIDSVRVKVQPVADGASIEVTVGIHGRTGVEMEAMTGAAVGALALYDMIKGIDREAFISSTMVMAKSGGRSGEWRRE